MNYEKSLLVNWKQFIKKVIPAILAIVMFASIINTSIDVKAANKVEDFVVRMYKVCLDREADSSGKKYWCDQLKNQKDTGVVSDGNIKRVVIQKRWIEKLFVGCYMHNF